MGDCVVAGDCTRKGELKFKMDIIRFVAVLNFVSTKETSALSAMVLLPDTVRLYNAN
jgi:hypothetical protein